MFLLIPKEPIRPAAEMEGVVSIEERRRRNKMLTILSEKKKRYFYEKHLGQHRAVLFEVHKDKELMSGFTDNYIKVTAAFDAAMINQLQGVQLLNIDENGLVNVIMQDIPENIFDFV